MLPSIDSLLTWLESPFLVYMGLEYQQKWAQRVREIIEDNKRLIQTNADLYRQIETLQKEQKTDQALNVLYPPEQHQWAVEGWDFP